ncbi:hypothetical protein EZV62_019282 [Acer yangbiense]|uniref:Uncharacterized protein n=1 Tax=Acer yangbiense TaxID=1000413 RepID=A0A5C7HCW4_9ROSI|nr:hypothetical protein EZV62_019282 [Acer yangbiense]
MSMEEDLISTANSYFSEITEIQIETSAILETLNNVEHRRKLEIEEKNKVIAELEKELKAQKAETEKMMSSMMVLIKELELENGSCEEETEQVVDARVKCARCKEQGRSLTAFVEINKLLKYCAISSGSDQ